MAPSAKPVAPGVTRGYGSAPADAPTGGSAERNGLTSVARAFAILHALRESGTPLSLSAIAADVGLAPSSAHSVLVQLLAEGAVAQVRGKRYVLGPESFDIGAAFARDARLYRSIWFELVWLANELKVTSALAVPWRSHHLVLAAHHGGPEAAVAYGGRVPLAASSWGKVHFSWSGSGVPAEVPAFTAASLVDPVLLAAECERVRDLGYATDRGEFDEHIGGVAAPLTSAERYEGLASLLAPLGRIDELGLDELGRQLAALASRASLMLGDRTRMPTFGGD